MKKVQVLMSTYNGEKYLEEQLNSILKQSYPEISLLIRDDGSSDRTLEILERYAKKYENIEYYSGKNIGVVKSFFDVMRMADREKDYFAFADQDDVWLPDKIKRAVKLLDKKSESVTCPMLYCSKTTIVNEKLEKIDIKFRKYEIKPAFGNALVENIATGCTEVFNRELLEMVVRKIPTKNIVMHDWWLYLSAAAFGSVIYDKKSNILYRQHRNNEIGMQTTRYGEFLTRKKNFKRSKGAIHRQAIEFRHIYGKEYQENELTDIVADYQKNWNYHWKVVTSNKIYRQGKLDDLIFRVLFLFKQR